MYGVDSFLAVLNAPQSAFRREPHPRRSCLARRPRDREKVMRLSLTWDHRVLDGAPAAVSAPCAGCSALIVCWSRTLHARIYHAGDPFDPRDLACENHAAVPDTRGRFFTGVSRGAGIALNPSAKSCGTANS
jgi:hypothetical protein